MLRFVSTNISSAGKDTCRKYRGYRHRYFYRHVVYYSHLVCKLVSSGFTMLRRIETCLTVCLLIYSGNSKCVEFYTLEQNQFNFFAKFVYARRNHLLSVSNVLAILDISALTSLNTSRSRTCSIRKPLQRNSYFKRLRKLERA